MTKTHVALNRKVMLSLNDKGGNRATAFCHHGYACFAYHPSHTIDEECVLDFKSKGMVFLYGDPFWALARSMGMHLDGDPLDALVIHGSTDKQTHNIDTLIQAGLWDRTRAIASV